MRRRSAPRWCSTCASRPRRCPRTTAGNRCSRPSSSPTARRSSPRVHHRHRHRTASSHGSRHAVEIPPAPARIRAMSYENPPVPHEVNVSRESPLAQFLRLCAGISLCIVIGSALLWLTGGWLARRIPYATEQAMVGSRVFGFDLLDAGDGEAPDAAHARIESYLAELVARLAPRMDLPEGMAPIVHLADSDTPN